MSTDCEHWHWQESGGYCMLQDCTRVKNCIAGNLPKTLETGDELAKAARTVREILASVMRRIYELGWDSREIFDHLDVGNVEGMPKQIDERIQAWDKLRGEDSRR